MIISCSGIGGSGKSTALATVVANQRAAGRSVEVIAVREYWWWPRIAQRYRGRQTHASIPHETRASTHTSIFTTVRAVFYLIDAWRIHVWVICPKSRKGVLVLCDRYYHEFFLEFGTQAETAHLTRISRWCIQVLPRPDAAFVLWVRAEEAHARKHEYDLLITRLHEERYRTLIESLPFRPFILDAACTEDAVARGLDGLVSSLAIARQRISPYGFLLYALMSNDPHAPVYLPVLLVEYKRLFYTAVQNRCMWGFLAREEQVRVWGDEHERQALIARVRAIAADITKRRAIATALVVQAKLTGTTVIKERNVATELGTDIDLVSDSPEAYEHALHAFASYGKVQQVTPHKAEVVLADAVPIDLHLDLYFGGFRLVRGALILTEPSVGDCVTTIAHALSELTLVTIGDAVETGTNHALYARARDIAREAGWGYGVRYWEDTVTHPSRYGWRFPVHIPLIQLLRMKGSLYFHAFHERTWVLAVARDLVTLTRAVRARMKGGIPFHDHWSGCDRDPEFRSIRS